MSDKLDLIKDLINKIDEQNRREHDIILKSLEKLNTKTHFSKAQIAGLITLITTITGSIISIIQVLAN